MPGKARRAGAIALAAALLALFFIANRGAWQGFFSADDLDTLGWVRIAGWDQWWFTASPLLSEDNFRPVGAFVYRILAAGTEGGALPHFGTFVLWLQLCHLANCLLLWFLLRSLAIGPWPALAATLFYALHPATLAVHWKPMFVYDLHCGLFGLLTLILYQHGKIVPAAITFLLAFRSKEIAVMLPLLLAGLEWAGQRRWRRLAPFFAISALFGFQALLQNSPKKGTYRLRANMETLLQSFQFYMGHVGGFRWSGLLFLPAALVQDWRVRVGAASLFLILVPHFLLPERLESAYLYVPLIGAAMAIGALLEKIPRPLVAAGIAVWLGVTYLQLRQFRRAELADAADRRFYVEQLMRAAAAHGRAPMAYEDGMPPRFGHHGAAGAWHIAISDPSLEFRALRFDPEWRDTIAAGAPLVSWDASERRLMMTQRQPGRPAAPLIDMRHPDAVWQLETGWARLADGGRQMLGTGRARVSSQGSRFVLAYRVPESPALERRHRLTVMLDGEWLGAPLIDAPGPFMTYWPAPAGLKAEVRVELRVDPDNQGPALLDGIFIERFGFQ